jgi:uncharacterized lipoprotein NlpE involved in copper resistance
MNTKKSLAVLFLVALVISGLSSCLSNRGNDGHNSRDSLNWEGIYSGTIPSGSGPGINVRMWLNRDESYVLRYEYLDRPNNIFSWTESFQWDKNGYIISFKIENVPSYYQVAEDKLIQLDMKGKPISGILADLYVLRKEL